MDLQYNLPNDRTLIGDTPFRFHCHSGVSCYLSCCRQVNLLLFPYDIIVLKNHLGISSHLFLQRYVQLCEGSHPFFPGLMLRMNKDDDEKCPFLGKEGCTVYKNRPSACRTYPLERGVERPGHGLPLQIHYFLTHHPYCKGHFESREFTIEQWVRDQLLEEYNYYNDLWAELDAFFATNPWAGEGKGGPYQQLSFMVCYNLDDFRTYADNNALLNKFELSKEQRRRIAGDDGALLRFGFDWLEFILGGRKKLRQK